MRTCAVILMVTLLCVAAMASDEKPNFSGVWKRGEATNSVEDTIEHQDPNLKVTFKTHFSGGRFSGGMSGELSYTADGVEKTSKSANGRESWTTVNWRRESLVIFRVTKDSYRVSVTRETWTLSQDGRTLTKNKRTIDMDGVTESTQVFQKQ